MTRIPFRDLFFLSSWTTDSAELVHWNLMTGAFEYLAGDMAGPTTATSRGDARIDLFFEGMSVEGRRLEHMIYIAD